VLGAERVDARGSTLRVTLAAPALLQSALDTDLRWDARGGGTTHIVLSGQDVRGRLLARFAYESAKTLLPGLPVVLHSLPDNTGCKAHWLDRWCAVHVESHVNMATLLAQLPPTPRVMIVASEARESHVKSLLLQPDPRAYIAVYTLASASDCELMYTSVKGTFLAAADMNARDAEALAESVLVFDLLRHRRRTKWRPDPERVEGKGYAGVYVQYTHARLCGIERVNSGVVADVDADDAAAYLREPVATSLALAILDFPAILARAFATMEPSVLVKHLVCASKTACRAVEILRVKDMPWSLAASRLALLRQARLAIAAGLRALGLEPIERI